MLRPRFSRGKHESVGGCVNLNRVALRESIGQDLAGQCILQTLLNYTFDRTRSVNRVISFVGDQLTLVYAEIYATPPIVILWPANDNAATSYSMSGNDSFWIESFTTGFVLTYTEQSAASDEEVEYNYLVIDTSNTPPA